MEVTNVEGPVIIYINYFDKQMSMRVVNSPLAESTPSNEALQLRHDINRLTIEYFNGKYCQKPLAIILKKEFV